MPYLRIALALKHALPSRRSRSKAFQAATQPRRLARALPAPEASEFSTLNPEPLQKAKRPSFQPQAPQLQSLNPDPEPYTLSPMP